MQEGKKSYFIIVKDIQQLSIQYNPLKFNQIVGTKALQQTVNNKSIMINFIKVGFIARMLHWIELKVH